MIADIELLSHFISGGFLNMSQIDPMFRKHIFLLVYKCCIHSRGHSEQLPRLVYSQSLTHCASGRTTRTCCQDSWSLCGCGLWLAWRLAVSSSRPPSPTLMMTYKTMLKVFWSRHVKTLRLSMMFTMALVRF